MATFIENLDKLELHEIVQLGHALLVASKLGEVVVGGGLNVRTRCITVMLKNRLEIIADGNVTIFLYTDFNNFVNKKYNMNDSLLLKINKASFDKFGNCFFDTVNNYYFETYPEALEFIKTNKSQEELTLIN